MWKTMPNRCKVVVFVVKNGVDNYGTCKQPMLTGGLSTLNQQFTSVDMWIITSLN